MFPCFLAGCLGFMTNMVSGMIHFVSRDEKTSRVYYIWSSHLFDSSRYLSMHKDDLCLVMNCCFKVCAAVVMLVGGAIVSFCIYNLLLYH